MKNIFLCSLLLLFAAPVGAVEVARSAPDGHTLLLRFDGTMVINPHVFAKTGFDTLRDFAPVTKLGDAGIITLAPAKTPRPVVERLQKEISAVLGTPEVKERYAVLGIDPAGSTPEEYAAEIKADLARWEGVVKKANIRIE